MIAIAFFVLLLASVFVVMIRCAMHDVATRGDMTTIDQVKPDIISYVPVEYIYDDLIRRIRQKIQEDSKP